MEIETQEVNTLIAARSTTRFIVSQSANRSTRSRHHYVIDPVAPRHDPARGRKLTPSRGLSALVGVPIDVGHTSKSEEKTAELSTAVDEMWTNEYFGSGHVYYIKSVIMCLSCCVCLVVCGMLCLSDNICHVSHVYVCHVVSVMLCLSCRVCRVVSVMLCLSCRVCRVVSVMLCPSCCVCHFVSTACCVYHVVSGILYLTCCVCPVVSILLCLSCCVCPVISGMSAILCLACCVCSVMSVHVNLPK